nr:WXG100 family type VII secretion target [Streptomyces sp. SID5468]
MVRSELGSAGPTIDKMAGEIAGELHQLIVKLQPLAETWINSQASSYYEGLQQEWNTAAEGLFGPDGVLGQIAVAMNVNFQNYSEAEWANMRTWAHGAPGGGHHG